MELSTPVNQVIDTILRCPLGTVAVSKKRLPAAPWADRVGAARPAANRGHEARPSPERPKGGP